VEIRTKFGDDWYGGLQVKEGRVAKRQYKKMAKSD